MNEKEQIISQIIDEVIDALVQSGYTIQEDMQEDPTAYAQTQQHHAEETPTFNDETDMQALTRMQQATTARIGVGSAGPRLRTQTLLRLRADHANAKDAVMMDVDEAMIKELGLVRLETQCHDKNEFLTRPDLGRRLTEEGAAFVKENCIKTPDVQICVADGLSSTAINANIKNILPILLDGLNNRNLTVGTTVFIKNGRVAVEDQIAELVGAKVVCIFVGERPGLRTAESMSAYIAYNARVGMAESRRTVVSNIHKDGINAVEAGAYIADLIEKILEHKASGVELQN